MTLLKRLQEEARKQARWLHALIELKDVENSLDGITANTVTAVLDEIESEARDLYLESDDENYQRALTDIKAFIRKGMDMNNTHQALIEETKPKLVNTFVLSDDSWDVILQDTIDTVIEGERKQAALIVEEMMEEEEHWKPITNRILDKTPPNKV